jgi:hypothetical protein
MRPAYTNYLKYVKFAPSNWKSWDDISNWYYIKLYKPKVIITDRINNKAKELTQNCSNEIEKLFDYVQSIRYVAIELGRGGIIPNSPEKST